MYHGGDAFGAWGSPTWQFHQNLMYSFVVASKLCLFADNRNVYQGPGNGKADPHMQIGFLSDKVVALHLPAM